jgi:outer membrane protein assembly factor BamB
MRKSSQAVMLLLIALACRFVCAEVSGATPQMGWRGDGNGKYPDANPPLDWGRTSNCLKTMAAQARKPKPDQAPSNLGSMNDGVIRQWLVLGPVPIPDGKKLEELLPNIETLAPDENEKAGELTWKAVSAETSCLDLCAVFNVPNDKKDIAAFAHAYIYSGSGQPINYNILSQGQGSLRLWLNGKPLFNAGDKIDIDYSGGHAVLPLKKGWNSVLVLNAKTSTTRKTWWNQGSFYGNQADGFDSRGIVWSVFTPAPGSSAPVIAGDRIFVTAERGTVYCANKADGKLLWARTISYYDFLTDEERKANPQVLTELAPLLEQQKKIDQADIASPWVAPTLESQYRWSVEGPLYKLTAKISRSKYRDPTASWLSDGEAGMSVPSPATDGKFVYALFGTGIVVCYDRDGNRQWVKLLKTRQIEHGYGTSPLLVDGKLVINFDDFYILDAKTGAVVVERPKFSTPDGFGTGCILPAGKDRVFFAANGEIVRLSDGKPLTVSNGVKGLAQNFIVSPVIDNGVCYNITGAYGGAVSFKLPPLQGDSVTPEVLHTVQFDTYKLPHYYEPWFIASPLYHDGLLYCVGNNGNLTVVDMAKGEVLYQRLIDLDIFMPYNGRLLKGGACACPTLAGKYIYIWGNQGTCLVIEPGRTFKQVARLRIEAPLVWNGNQRQEATMSNPVFEGDRMYYRSEFNIYCIGPK